MLISVHYSHLLLCILREMLQEKPLLSIGQATVEYNGSKVLEGKYNCLSESKTGFDKDTIHVELQNKLLPIGVDYLHGRDHSISSVTVVGT